MMCRPVEVWKGPGWLCATDKEEESSLSAVGVREVYSGLLVDEEGNVGGIYLYIWAG